MTDTPRRFLDDPDANVVYPITDANEANVDWATPTVKASKAGVVVSLTCTWLGDPAPTRNLRVPVSGLVKGSHVLRLVVPNENDVALGTVTLA